MRAPLQRIQITATWRERKKYELWGREIEDVRVFEVRRFQDALMSAQRLWPGARLEIQTLSERGATPASAEGSRGG